jgi:hypothetical protein
MVVGTDTSEAPRAGRREVRRSGGASPCRSWVREEGTRRHRKPGSKQPREVSRLYIGIGTLIVLIILLIIIF